MAEDPQPRPAASCRALDAAVTSEANPDNVRPALEMYSGHRERAMNSDSFNRRPK
jgi:hypothetical protein